MFGEHVYNKIGAIVLLILAGCTTTGIDNNPMSRDDAMASAKRVSGSDVAVCEAISYTGTDGLAATAYVVGWDGDGDGFAMVPTSSTDIYAEVDGYSQYLCLIEGMPVGYVLIEDDSDIGADCDDADDTVSGSSIYVWPDTDGDNFGDILAASTEVCGPVPTGYVTNDNDCADGDGNTFPGAASEESTEEFGALACMTDADDDGYGDDSPETGVTAGTDCDDVQTAGIEINPGMEEVCNGVDDNCGGFEDPFGDYTVVDEVYYPDFTSFEEADRVGAIAFYSDDDEDGASGTFVGYACEGTSTDDLYADESTDCDDANAARYPGNTEVCDSSNVDEDCDTVADDADGSATGQSTWYLDGDSDGYTAGTTVQVACDQPVGSELTNESDCDDSNDAVSPGATEVCNGIDDNCAGGIDDGVASTFYADADSDTYGNPSVTQSTCTASAGYVSNSGDCNDAEALAYTGATEVCDGVDNDCDAATDEGVMTTYYADADGDDYGVTASTTTACSEPSGYAAVGADCNDAAASINPGATETCNSMDDDCDSSTDEGLATTVSYLDSDSDGYGDLDYPHSAYCAVPSGYAGNSTDCNDGNEDVNPGAAQVANNGLDDNCDGTEPAEEVCAVPTFSSTSVYYQLWLDNLDVSTDDSNWNYPGLARGRADAEICAQNVAITEGDSWKANGTFSTTATSGTFYASSWSFAAYGNGDGYENFDYITVMGVEVAVTKTSWGGGADGLFEIDFTLPVE